jgi:iron complex transport system ATP-binding protein
MTAWLEARDFSLAIAGCQLLKNISFRVEAGQYLSILGPNGAGKSTLLKSLLRLVDGAQTSGEIRLKDRSLNAFPRRELARLIGYVPQAGGWIPPYSIKEFVLLSRYSLADHAQDQATIAKVLEITGLAAFADRPLATLSGGERQKAYLAAALAQETPILALDEPSSFLDPRRAFELDNLLRDLNRDRKLTIITVTHDLNHPSLIPHGLALVLKKGRLTYFGPSPNLFDGQILEQTFDHQFVHLTHPQDGRSLVIAQ